MTTETTAPVTEAQIKQRINAITGWPPAGTPVTSASVLAKSLAVSAQLRWARSMSDYFAIGDDRFAESIQVMCAKLGLLHLLADLMDRDPARADELAAAVCAMWDDGGEVGTTLWEHCRSLGIDAGEVNRLEDAWQATPEAQAARKPPAADGEKMAADLASARRAVQTLSNITGSNMQAMEAARIEMRQTGPESAMQWIINSLPEFWEDPDTAWDGTESAQAWFDRTRDAYRNPETLTEATAYPGYRQLAPAERLAVTVASAQLARGENPPVNTTAALLLTIKRLTGEGQEQAAREGK
jgi:hypothetical protein